MLRAGFYSVFLNLLLAIIRKQAIVDNSFHSVWNVQVGRSDFRPIETRMKKRLRFLRVICTQSLLISRCATTGRTVSSTASLAATRASASPNGAVSSTWGCHRGILGARTSTACPAYRLRTCCTARAVAVSCTVSCFSKSQSDSCKQQNYWHDS